MRFLLDENVDYPLAEFLNALGYSVTAIAYDYPHALKDTEVLAIAAREQRILITNDRDFGQLIVRRRLPHAGVILFRLHDEQLQAKQLWLLHVLTHHSRDLQDLVVITDQKVRVRRVRS
jgi:predicted nuclease of predicted toxin-antitoxin system